MYSPMPDSVRPSGILADLVGIIACGLAILALSSCDPRDCLPFEEPVDPCKAASVDEFAGGCSMTWQCHDGVFRIECTTAAGEPAELCRCIQDREEVGEFSMAGVCPADSGNSEAGGDEPTRQAIARDGCGWNVITSAPE